MVTLKSALIKKENINNTFTGGAWTDSKFVKFSDLLCGNVLYDEKKDNSYIVCTKEIASEYLNLKFSSDIPELVFVVFDQNGHFRQFSNPKSWEKTWPNCLYNNRKIDKIFTKSIDFKNEMDLFSYMTNDVPKILKQV